MIWVVEYADGHKDWVKADLMSNVLGLIEDFDELQPHMIGTGEPLAIRAADDGEHITVDNSQVDGSEPVRMTAGEWDEQLPDDGSICSTRWTA